MNPPDLNLLSKHDINNIIKSLDRQTSIFRQCRLFDKSVLESHLLDPKKYMHNKVSASLTEIVDAKMNVDTTVGVPRVFFKIWVNWNDIPLRVRRDKIHELYYSDNILIDEYTTSLNYEAGIYQYITDNIILRDVSPNFVPILLNQTCSLESIKDNLLQFMTTDASHMTNFENVDKLYKKLLRISNAFKGTNVPLSMRFIMTGSAQDVITMHDFCDFVASDPHFKQDEYNSIIFQFFYVFYVLHVYKIVHNDNHFSNTLIQVLDKPVTFEIDVYGTIVKFTTRYVVKLFDWDRAYNENLGENMFSRQEYQINSRQISRFTPNRDFATFLCHIKSYKIKQFNDILSYLIPKFATVATKLDESQGEIFLPNALTPMLASWLKLNTDKISKSVYSGDFVTLSKTDLETFVDPPILNMIKQGVDTKLRMANAYEETDTFFFRIDGDDLVIPRGWTCNPLFDNKNINIERFFTDKQELAKLTRFLVVDQQYPIYSYKFKGPTVL